jgi:hypothetical protein
LQGFIVKTALVIADFRCQHGRNAIVRDRNETDLHPGEESA